jgi:hypothetical protein
LAFADKDDLKTGAGAEYVDVSKVVLVFCTVKYFQSRACARELLRAVLKGKPLIAVLEPDSSRGGMDREAIRALLLTERFRPHGQPQAPADQPWAVKWALHDEVAAWGYSAVPTGEAIFDNLFREDPIEWNRFTAFQIVSVRQVAERLLTEKDRGSVYVQGEVGSQPLTPPPLTRGRTFHLYCSPHNAGAKELGAELNELLVRRSDGGKRDGEPLLQTTTSLDNLDRCEHMLLYLTARTWTNGDDSIALAREVAKAHRKGVHLLLAHEFPCCLDALVPGGVSRCACDFNDFWNEGWTPKHLLAGEANVYRQIAMAIKPGPFRPAGLAIVLGKLSEGGGERAPIELSDETEEAGMSAYVPAQLQLKATDDAGERQVAPPRKARASALPANDNRAFQKRGPSAVARRSQHKSALLASTGGEPAPSQSRTSSATHQAASEGSTPTNVNAAALATLRRSCSAHDARRTSSSRCVEAAGREPAPPNSIRASLPDPSNLPCPVVVGAIAEEGGEQGDGGNGEVEDERAYVRLPRGTVEDGIRQRSHGAAARAAHPAPPSAGRVQLSPAVLDSDDESEALDRVFDAGCGSATTARAQPGTRGNDGVRGSRLGGGTSRRSVQI